MKIQKLFLSVAFFVILPELLFGQTGRYFDAPDHPEMITISILHPVPRVVKAVIGLREQGLLPRENVRYVGIFHEKETTNTEEGELYRESAGLVHPLFDWFFFHRITGSLDPDNLFRKNPCSEDFEKIFSGSDAVIFFGGDDIPPDVYGEKTRLFTDIETPYRHYMELSFVFHLLGGFQDNGFRPLMDNFPAFPVLGICLGEQSLNTGTGGTLVQDIEIEIYGNEFLEDILEKDTEQWHRNPWKPLRPEEKLYTYSLHHIRLDPAGPLVRDMGFSKSDAPLVLSSHHQAVKKLGKGFRTAATSIDGKVVEGIWHEKYPNVLGVQFHPEYPELWNRIYRERLHPDSEGVSIRELLEADPPAMLFQKSVWLWFTERILSCHAGRTGK